MKFQKKERNKIKNKNKNWIHKNHYRRCFIWFIKHSEKLTWNTYVKCCVEIKFHLLELITEEKLNVMIILTKQKERNETNMQK